MSISSDLTVVFYTANYISEYFWNNVKANLVKAVGDLPLISVSQKPMDFGENICVGNIGRSHLNIYRQILTGTQAAKTKYVALAEDDIFYPQSHFEIRPSSDNVFCYDINEWRFYTWTRPPIFSYQGNIVVHQLISSRDYLCDAMERRFAANPDESKVNLSNWKDPGRHDDLVGDIKRNKEAVMGKDPMVVFSHEDAFGYLHLGKRKAHAPTRREHLDYWGSAEDMLKLYKRRDDGSQ